MGMDVPCGSFQAFDSTVESNSGILEYVGRRVWGDILATGGQSIRPFPLLGVLAFMEDVVSAIFPNWFKQLTEEI